MVVEKNQPNKKLNYPKSIFFIICYEFCEVFSYAGVRTILVLYLRNQLGYNDDTSTVIFHIFSMCACFFTVFGAVLADSWLGKFRTIFQLGIVATVGQLVMAVSAVPPLNLPERAFALVGLGLITCGFGGMKPCISPLGGDQFVLPDQERHFTMFFSLFYFAANAGALIAIFVIPILRQDVSCFGANNCFSLTFLVLGAMMIIALVIFILGKSMYTLKSPERNVVVDVTKCIARGIRNKLRAKKSEKREHWLDHAEDKFDRELISDIKSALAVLKMFLPVPIFWALFDQQGSRWTIQATRMNGEMGQFLLRPDQMQLINPLLIIVLIPIFQSCLYPLMAKLRFVRTPLQKMTAGGILTGAAFVISALVELKLEATYAVAPSSGVAQVRLFNTLNCPVILNVENDSFVLHGLSVWENKFVRANGNVTLKYSANYSRCHSLGLTSTLRGETKGSITGIEGRATSWVITPAGISYSYADSVDKTRSGAPAVRGLIYLSPAIGSHAALKLVKNSLTVRSLNVSSDFGRTPLAEVEPGTYDVYLNDTRLRSSIDLKLGGIYTLVGYVNDANQGTADIVAITNPNSVHMLWLLPQYIVLTIGEVLFAVTGLEFAFTQAPVSMKSMILAAWILTVGFGNLIVVVVAETSLFRSQASEFFLFAGLMWADMLLFGVMAMFYRYAKTSSEETENGDFQLEEKGGSSNPAFEDDE